MKEIQATQVEFTESTVLLLPVEVRILALYLVFSNITLLGVPHRVSLWWKSRILTLPLLTCVGIEDYISVCVSVRVCVMFSWSRAVIM